ncbi:MAG: MarR family transcriptional regulator [Treponema sp.]|nr:MarR family transcriptional regulator [Treponema sp.]
MENVHDEKIISSLTEMGKQDNRFDSLYRRVSASFEMSACAMWIFYYLLLSDDGMTQLEMTEAMMFPKQTVNSAVQNLVKDNLVTLEAVQGTRNSKKVLLSKKGRDYAEKTVKRLLQAEIRATQKFGEEKTQAYISLREEYMTLLKAEFESDFLKEE